MKFKEVLRRKDIQYPCILRESPRMFIVLLDIFCKCPYKAIHARKYNFFIAQYPRMR